jgi:hypothetical protein
MAQIVYVEKHELKVYLDGKHVGTIRKEREADSDGYRYYPRGSKTGGEFFALLSYCKASLGHGSK